MAGVNIENPIDSIEQKILLSVHVRENCREYSREYLSRMLRRESNSCQLARSECSESGGSARILKVRNISLHMRMNCC
jgi:hypothetical protein